MNIISYHRTATPKECFDENSVILQCIKCEQWAYENKHKIIQRYFDDGFSGIKKISPSLQIILDQLGNPKQCYQAIVITSYSRLTRDIQLFTSIVKTLTSHNVVLMSVTEPNLF